MAGGGPLTAVPPGVAVVVGAAVAAALSRRAAHALGVALTAGTLLWALVVPDGVFLSTNFLGFEAVLLRVDGFSRLMAIIFGLIGAAAVVYSYASDADGIQTAFALSYVGTSVGAVLAGDWLALLFFWELMAATSTLLIWYYGGKAIRAGFRYALLHGIGGSLVMAGIVWHYDAVGSFLFSAADGITAGVPAVLVAVGIGVNVGFVGLHAWLPDTYPRPHVAASVFLCVYTTKTGVYGMYRAFPEGHLWIAYMGGAMAVFGAGMALLQDDMRRLLSYHIQSQVGYMVAGVGIGTALATSGAFAHVFNHILYKSLLFMTVGVVIYRTGKERLKKVGGLYREMPLTAVTFGIAALSIAGFPGFNGFVSKGMVIGAAHKEHLDALWWLLMLGGVGTFLSFIKLGYHAFLHGKYDGPVADANRGQSVAMVAIAGLCVIYGVYPDALFGLLPGTKSSKYVALPAAGAKYTVFTVDHLVEGIGLAVLGVAGFAVLKKPLSNVSVVPDVDALYNRVAFYGTRGVVVGVTELYAAVDRAVVAAARTVAGAVRDPASAVTAVARPTDGDRSGTPASLRAGIGTTILVLVVVVALVLAALM